MSITEYNVKAPKIILEKLKKANLDSDKDKLVEIISQKFSERIAEIKNKGATRETELSIGQLNYLVPSLGEVLAD